MNQKLIIPKRGFTLIELLIVIGIVAILAVVTILVLNPAELLRQARDAVRVDDLDTLNRALNLYIVNSPDPYLGSSTRYFAADGITPTANGWCFVSYDPIYATGSIISSPTHCGGRFNDMTDFGPDPIIRATTSRATDGTGWLPVNFNSVGAGVIPFSVLPVDPVLPNTPGVGKDLVNGGFIFSDDRYYAYGTNGRGGFEINASLESKKYASSSEKDGGDNLKLYEVGNIPGSNL